MSGFLQSVAAAQEFLLLACLVALAAVGAVFLIVLFAAPLWDALRRWLGLGVIQKSVVAAFVLGLVYYGATKQVASSVKYDGGLAPSPDNANVITNDLVKLYWSRDASGGTWVPETATVYIDCRLIADTNAAWTALGETTVGAWGWSGSLEGATNYDFNVWAYYIPPEPVHTNGVWVYKTLKDRRGENALPLRARVEADGRAIATPKEKRRDTENE